MKTRYVYLFALVLAVTGCTSVSQLTLLQDVHNNELTINRPEFVIGVGDQLQIKVISHLSKEAADAFNTDFLYTVQSDSCIVMPVVGKVKIAGQTETESRAALARLVEDKLPQCMVHLKITNATATVLGEVNYEGAIMLDHPITIFEALGKANGLTSNAQRDRIQVVRIENRIVKIYEVNLLSGDIFASPCYYILKGDIIYVRPKYSRTILNKQPINQIRYGN